MAVLTRRRDPRLQWLLDAAALLYAELEAGDQIAGLSATVCTRDGQVVFYGVNAMTGEVSRQVTTDLRGLLGTADAVMNYVADATVPEPLPGGE